MRIQKLTFFIFFILSISNISIAQQKCGFDTERQKQLKDQNFVELEKAAEKRIQDAIKNRDLSKMNGSLLTIPVVIHVLHLGEAVGTGTNISDAQIQSSIDNLNDYYRGQIPTSPIDFEIEFALAQRDPNCNATTGINRIDASVLPGYSDYGVNVRNSNGASYNDILALSSWPQTDYFNVWIVSELDNNNGGFGFQGYAYFYNETFSTHGSVMMSTVFGHDPGNTNGWGLNSNGDNSTVVHEVGHFFHLYHTFQGDDTNNDGVSDSCPADTTVGTDSDGCADTVPHQRETSTCPANNSCTGNPWLDNNTINNIMSYYYCSDRLTNDQKTRVRAAMEGTSLVNSKGATLPDPGYTPPVSACSTNAAPNIDNHYAGIVNVELNGNSFASFSTFSDGGNIDSSANCNNYFDIDVTMTNTLNVTMFPANVQQLGVWIDWNDDGDFDDEAEEQITVRDNIASGSIESINLIYPTTIPYGDYVRIRLITELGTTYGFSSISSACYASLVYGQSEDYTIYVEPQGSVTYTYNNTWSPIDPNGIAGTNDNIVIDAGNAIISSNTTCNTIIVNPGSALTVDTGVTLTSNTTTLNSTSQSYSSLIVDGTITGTVNYNRYTAQLGTNDLISAPVGGQTFGSFESVNSNLAASGNIRAFAPYNTTIGSYENYDTTSNASTIINAGVGYRAATTDGSTLMFTGTVRTNDILDIPISDASAGSAWNLIGNPYPSYIDFDTFFNLNASELDSDSAFQCIYGYDGDASNGWTAWNLATIADGTITELIAPGQAFFVKSKVGGGSIDFTTAMRRTGYSDDFISGRQPIVNVALCKLNLSSASNNSSTQIYFIEGTTRGLDVGYDAGSYSGNVAEFSIFSNLVEDNTGLDMAIQTLPYNDFNSIVVPLGINAEVGVELTIGIDNMSSLPSNINVYLEDNESNTLTLLNDSDYTFSSSVALNGTGRFFIRYSSVTLSIENNDWNNLQIYNTSSPKEIIVRGQLKGVTKANLYDIRGRLIFSQKLEQSNISNIIDVSMIRTGIYIIKVFNDNQIKTQKLIIK